MTLRPYQQQSVYAALAGFGQFRKQLGVAPTGAGKTIMFSALAKALLPRRTLILAHRTELIEQAREKLYASTGIRSDVEKAESVASLNAPVVVGSIQTLQGARLERWPQDHFGLVVVDEAHHVTSDSYRNTLARFDSHAKVIGVTATPDRGDKRNLGEYFENIAFEIGLFDLIHQGYLSRICVKSIPIQIDLNGVRQTAGDFNESDLGAALEPYLRQVAIAIREEAAFRRTLVFVPLCSTSRKFVEICREEGISAAHVDGESPDRKQIAADFTGGRYDLVSNAMLWTEGFDDPGIDCVCVLRPTKSRALFSQMVGRGTRIAPAKSNLLLLDFLWLHSKLNLIRPAHLIASTEEQAQAMTEISEERARGGKQELLDLEDIATEEQAKREERLRKAIESKSRNKSKTVDAMEWCLKMGEHDLVGYEPTMKWESTPVTEKQAVILKRAGIDSSTVSGKGHASKLIDAFFRSKNLQPASDKIKAKMRQFGIANWQTATAGEGRKFMADLRKEAA